MRIIAGTFRGRKLIVPSGLRTRPTPARVREALFSMLDPYLQDRMVLDLFAGSGALGLEALSRGCKHVTFVEKDMIARRSLEKNLQIAPPSHFELLAMSARRAWTHLNQQKRRFDLVFLDPPYAKNWQAEWVETLTNSPFIESQALIVVERGLQQNPVTAPAHWEILHDRRYGDVCVQILQHHPKQTS